MKTKSYRNSKTTGRGYLKPVGSGWEVGFVYGTKPLFVGNFVHSKEANTWFGLMNREIRTFTRKYTVTNRVSTTWYTHFLSSQLYKKYYLYLDRLLARHNRNWNKAVNRDLRTYRRLSRQTRGTERTVFLRAA